MVGIGCVYPTYFIVERVLEEGFCGGGARATGGIVEDAEGKGANSVWGDWGGVEDEGVGRGGGRYSWIREIFS